MSDRRIHWRCFHCGEAFTKAQERWAREHFGATQDETPVCLMRVPGEGSLVTALRNAQAERDRLRYEACAEDGDLMRALYAQSADHAAALRQEEERGYAKGLVDGRTHPHPDMSPDHIPDAGKMVVSSDVSRLVEACRPFAALYEESVRAFHDGSPRPEQDLSKEAWGFNNAFLTWADFHAAAQALASFTNPLEEGAP